jgi:hypothetical protein
MLIPCTRRSLTMSKHVTEKYEHGEFIGEWVDEVPPLADDRKTAFVPSSPMQELPSQMEDLLSQVRGEMFSMSAMIMSVMADRFGEAAWEAVEKVLYDYGRSRAEEVARIMKIDPADARSVGRIFDLEDSQHGIKGEWVETGKNRAVKREYVCPLAAGAALCPEMCTRIAAAVERGTMDALGVKGKLSFPKLLSKGDPYCEVVLEVKG